MQEFLTFFNNILSISIPLPISSNSILHFNLFGLIVASWVLIFAITIIHALLSNSANKN